MFKLLLIALAGAAGTLARYGTGTALANLSGRWLFPFGTLAVNLLGCFLIGLFQGLFLERAAIRSEYQVAILGGFLGGYTTFSSFAWETSGFIDDGQWGRAMMNIILNNVLGIILVLVGFRLSKLI